MLDRAEQRSVDIAADLNNLKAVGSVVEPYLKPKWNVKWVTTREELKKLVKRLKEQDVISVDTETWGPVVLSDHLCLIQIGVPFKTSLKRDSAKDLRGEVFLIDVLALESEAGAKGQNPLLPLKKILESQRIKKVIHYAPFEREQFKKYGVELTNVDDTRTLARDLFPSLLSASLQACALEILNYEVSKEEQTSEWNRRPLTREQEDYAAIDAELDLKLWKALKELEEASRVSPSMSLEDRIKEIKKLVEFKRTFLLRLGILEEIEKLNEEIQLNRTLIEEALKARFEESGMEEEVKCKWGSAKVVHLPYKVIDYEKLRDKFPDIAEQIVREIVTKKDILEAVDILGLAVSANDIWEEIKVFRGKSEPSFSLSIDGVDENDNSLADVSKLNPSFKKVPSYLRDLLDAEVKRLTLLRVSGALHVLARIDKTVLNHSSAIKEELRKSAEEKNVSTLKFRSEAGSARLTIRSIYEGDVSKLRELYPQVAEIAVSKKATKRELIEALRRKGADPEAAEKVAEEFMIETGEYKKPFVRIHPNYAMYYKGEGLDEDTGKRS